MSDTPTAAPHGLDLDALRAWLATETAWQSCESLAARYLTGGKSNFTYEVVVDGRKFVLRRAPLGQTLSTAHDMAREYRVMTALGDTDVPIPRTYALCEDPGVIGAPFYLMELMEGTSYFRRSELEVLGPQRTRKISERLVDTLVRLHEVDPHTVGLDGFGRPEGFLGRQVRRWRKQLDASRTRDLRGLDSLHAQLADRVPADGPTAIVHGDFKLDNVLVHHDEPTALIDWEMSTLGDGLTDLALMIVYRRLGYQVGSASISDSASAPGFLSEGEILHHYATGTGRQVDGFGFYLALASFKLAGIVEGINFRHRNGQTVGGAEFEHLSEIPELLIASGLESIKEKI